jgi:hypothetical protein
MDYNTKRTKLIFPEYGRSIHKLVDMCLLIENKEERTKVAYAIVAIMGNLHPHLRDVPDFKHKLWNHIAIMSDFKLDIDWPYPKPDKEKLAERPDKLPYSDGKIKFKHYGKNIQEMFDKVNDFENEEERDTLIALLANHMKKLVVTWKKEHVDDEVVFKDIKKLTKDTVKIKDDLVLNPGWDMNANLNTGSSRNTKKKRSNYKRKN